MSGKQKEGYVEMEKKLKDMGVELNELAIAMCDYIQTGQKTEQLSKFWDNEDSFYKTFEKELENGDNPQKMAYLGGYNMLYHLINTMEKRNRLLREMNEKVSEYPELKKVMETLGKMEMKSMNFIDLSAKMEITEEQLDDILVHNIQYFNMHEREGRVKVSLSPLCRKILNFNKDTYIRKVGLSGLFFCVYILPFLFIIL